MTEREALKLALEALVLNNAEWKHLADSGDSGDWSAEDQDHYKQTEEAITAIKEALAQPEQEPVGHGGRPMTLRECMEAEEPEKKPMASVHIKDGRLVGSHRDESKPFLDGQYGLWPIESPPPQRKPLTDEEIAEMWPLRPTDSIIQFARAIEAAHGIKGEV